MVVIAGGCELAGAALLASGTLTALGVAFVATMLVAVCVTSAGLLFEAVQARAGHGSAESWILDSVFPQTGRPPW